MPSLLAGLQATRACFDSALPAGGRVALVLGGSAGEGVQHAAESFARAAMACGLHVAKKGSYPVTVGVGFSTAEVILSRVPIDYHGIVEPDVVLITSEHGLRHNLARIRGMARGSVWLDAGLPVPETRAVVRVRDFRGQAPREAARRALEAYVLESGVFAAEALRDC